MTGGCFWSLWEVELKGFDLVVVGFFLELLKGKWGMVCSNGK